jgi:hypothetical protein
MVFFLLFVYCFLILVVFHRMFPQDAQPAKSMVLCLAAVAVLNASWTNAFAITRPRTTVSLAVTSGGSAVTSVTTGSIVTLTATVGAGPLAVTTGQVNFCDASVNNCTDIHLLGTAQTRNGNYPDGEFGGCSGHIRFSGEPGCAQRDRDGGRSSGDNGPGELLRRILQPMHGYTSAGNGSSEQQWNRYVQVRTRSGCA